MSKRLHYLPRLDALRAIAALMVLVCHFLVDLKKPYFNFGGNGVDIFFVISGFLITGILLAQKNDNPLPRLRLIGNFIVKRALRLFPVYFLLLTVLALFSIYGGLWLCSKGHLWYYFTYTQNILFFKEGPQSSLLFHTWSLAVEEQFYLAWPFLLLLIPKRRELALLFLVFLSGIFFNIWFSYFVDTPGTVKGITLIHLDTLSAGALLAWCMHYRKEKVLAYFEKLALPVFLVSFPLTLLFSYLNLQLPFISPFLLMLMALSLVYMCTRPGPRFMDPLLDSKLLQRIGQISYGLYLLHKPVPFFFGYTCSKLGLPQITNPVLLFIIYFAISLSLAVLSWRLLESKMMRIKERFDS